MIIHQAEIVSFWDSYPYQASVSSDFLLTVSISMSGMAALDKQPHSSTVAVNARKSGTWTAWTPIYSGDRTKIDPFTIRHLRDVAQSSLIS